MPVYQLGMTASNNAIPLLFESVCACVCVCVVLGSVLRD